MPQTFEHMYQTFLVHVDRMFLFDDLSYETLEQVQAKHPNVKFRKFGRLIVPYTLGREVPVDQTTIR